VERRFAMNNYEMNLRFSELFKEFSELKTVLEKILSSVRPEETLWDNADIIKNWKVSERTLADWRKKGLISYVQVQSKIWYPQDARESFLKNHCVKVQLNDRRARS
jgi:hypothetical protein